MTASADEPHLGLVVEGRGELHALPILLRKRLHERGIYGDLLGKPVPCHGRGNALRPHGVEGKVAVAAVRPGCRGVLVVFDGEGDPVCELGPDLLVRCETAARGKPVAVCLAASKYEDWLVASAESLELSDLTFDPGRDAAKAIREALHPEKYVKPSWQPTLTARMDMARAAERNESLARLLRKFDELVDLLLTGGSSITEE